jgi:hypothetical protein
MMRSFDYRDRVTGNQRGYDLGSAPVVGIAAELRPFATTTLPGLRGLALGGRYDRAVLLQSAVAGADNNLGLPGKIDTTYQSFDVALHERWSLDDRTTLGGEIGFGGLDFGFSGAGAMQSELPSVAYRFVRTGADARIRVWRLALTASASYLVVTDSGPLSDRYPRASSGGVDAAAGIAIPLGEHVEARTGIRYQRFFHTMNPQPGDPNVAGGALDELARWDSSIALHY